MAFVLKSVYRIQVHGLPNYHKAGDRVLIVANHVSYLDPLILGACLPDKLTFVVNTHIAHHWLLRRMRSFITLFAMDPTNALSSKALIRYLQAGNKAVIFPEGRITVTGALMKVYNGTGMVADKSEAMVVPIRIEGAQYTPFSRLRGRLRLRWFPKITVTILPPRLLRPGPEVRGRDRRAVVGRQLSDLMTEMMFATSHYRQRIFSAFLDARKVHGGRHIILEDVQRKPLSYNRLTLGAYILGKMIADQTWVREALGILLPNTNSTVVVFLGMQLYGRVPAMLNYSLGAQGVVTSCQTAKVKWVISSRRFVQMGKLEALVEKLEAHGIKMVYLEDLGAQIGWKAKLSAWLLSRTPSWWYRNRHDNTQPEDPAVILFTSGSEGVPKAVVLSHCNLLANRAQLAARVDFSAHDIILNALPMFHSFGLTAGTLLPITSGIRTFLYPSPLHYRIVPELAYDTNASILFGTNTFLAGYARYAHPYDFYSVRYVFAGAEKLQDATRRVWSEKFGVRIFEGYGATETSPVLAANTPMEYKVGTVGRFLPSIEHQLKPVPGIAEGGQLLVRGPNVMLGYYLYADPGKLVPPQCELGTGWYDTGDIVNIDAEGYVTICGRVKRFAKVGGEMVSLTVVEDIASRTWPDYLHAAVALPDPQKGEVIVLLTQYAQAERGAIQRMTQSLSISELHIPRKLYIVEKLLLLGSGKLDYPAAQAMARELHGEFAPEPHTEQETE